MFTCFRLCELGPRLRLELLKIEEGISDGEVLYHKFIHKTPEEAATLRKQVVKRKLLTIIVLFFLLIIIILVKF